VVFHDRGLKRVTDVSERYEFRDRMKTLTIDDYNEEKSDWWIRDFTLEELKSLKVRQPRSNRPQLHSLNFKISTLEEIILESLSLKQTKEMKGNKSGLLI
jgi:glycerophosphoryl diester phosphodiesterase